MTGAGSGVPSHLGSRRGRGRRRLFALLVAVFLSLAAIAFRLADVQVLTVRRYEADAHSQDIHTTVLPALRGSILASDGQPLALSEFRPTITADPYQVADPGTEASRLAPLLHLSVASLEAKLRQHAGFVYLAHNVSDAAGAAITKLGLPGIQIEKTPERFHPAGQLALPLLGTINASGVGASGLEYAYNRLLSGTPGRLVQEVDPQGQAIAGGTIEDRKAVLGDDLKLTIDEPLQYQTEQALAQALVTSHGANGIAMVMDTHTGALLAVADLSTPSSSTTQTPALPVHLNAQGQVLAAGATTTTAQPVESPSANAFTEVYEPGSVEKLITVSAALSTGTITPDETFTIPNAYPVDGTEIHDAENHGTEKLSVTGIVAQSSNIGATQIVQRLGAQALYHYLHAYGLGSPTPVRFPGQSAGLITPESQLSPVSLATMSYGEGIAVTAAQMITAYNTVANGGVYVTPHLVQGVIGPDGHEHAVTEPPPHRVVSTTVAHEMAKILEQVVAAGTGTNAKVPSYAVAGKTGTAQFDGPHGYVPGYTVASFAGFAPAQNPAVTVMVVVNDTVDYGAEGAAPAFSTITRDALTDLHVPSYGPQPPLEQTALPQPVGSGAATTGA